MTPAAVGVLVAGLLLVALIAGGALLAQRRQERRWEPGPRTRPAAPARPREEPPTDPITTRTAQTDPPTVQHPNPLFGEGDQHPTPPPHGGNGRAP